MSIHQANYKKKRKYYRRKGKCLRCGKCCNFRYLFNDISWKSKIVIFVFHPKTLFIWIFKKDCPNLIKMGERSLCIIYKKRPWFCKAFPATPEDLIYKCGYNFKWRDK